MTEMFFDLQDAALVKSGPLGRILVALKKKWILKTGDNSRAGAREPRIRTPLPNRDVRGSGGHQRGRQKVDVNRHREFERMDVDVAGRNRDPATYFTFDSKLTLL